MMKIVITYSQQSYYAESNDKQHTQALPEAHHINRPAGHYRNHKPVGILQRGIEEIALFATEEIPLAALVATHLAALHLRYQLSAIGIVKTDVAIEQLVQQMFTLRMGDEFAVVVDDITMRLQPQSTSRARYRHPAQPLPYPFYRVWAPYRPQGLWYCRSRRRTGRSTLRYRLLPRP